MRVSPFEVVNADPLDTAASGMAAQRIRMNMLANNLANMHTTRDADGNFAPYLRREAIFKTGPAVPGKPHQEGVRVQGLLPSPRPFDLVYEPDHPEADGSGYRKVPAVSMAREMVRMIDAANAYDANLSGFTLSRGALRKDTEILD